MKKLVFVLLFLLLPKLCFSAVKAMYTINTTTDLNTSVPVGTSTYVNDTDTIYVLKTTGYEVQGNKSMAAHLVAYDHTLIGQGGANDTAYGTGWLGSTTEAPSQNAVYNKIQTLGGGHDAATMVNTSTINITMSGQEFTPSVNATLVATWNAATGVPQGAIIMVLTSCPSGYTELTFMGGQYLLATNTTNGDVNATAGSLALTGTPATLTGNITNAGLNLTSKVLSMDAATLTGNLTTAGLNLTRISLVMQTTSAASAGAMKNGTTTNTGTVAAHTHTVSGNLTSGAGNITNRTLTMDAYTATGNITVAAGNLTNSNLTMNSYTPAGTILPTYRKVIFCQKD